MEQPEHYYCFNPNCTQTSARVFSQQKRTFHHQCQSWVVSEKHIANLSKDNLPFDIAKPLNFNSQPIQTQAYLHFHKEAITNFIIEYSQTLRNEIQKEMKSFEDRICIAMNNIFSFKKYEQINSLANQQGLDAELKSMRLAQLLKKPLPQTGNLLLPSFLTSKLIISNLRADLQQLFSIENSNQDKNKKQQEVKLQQLENKTEEKKSQPFNLNLSLQVVSDRVFKFQPSPNKFIIKKENKDNQLSEIWNYIQKNCNLNTATKLMGQPLQKFYSHNSEEKESIVKCCYCQFLVNIKTKTKPQTNSACSFAILQHLYTNHLPSVLHFYHRLQGKYISNTIEDLFQKIINEQAKSVTIIDTCSLSNKKVIQLEANSFAFEVLHGSMKPMFTNQFIRGGNYREIMLLLGILIHYTAMVLKKKMFIHTSEQKCEYINNFCKIFNIQHVNTISEVQQKKLEGSIEVVKREKEIPNNPFIESSSA